MAHLAYLLNFMRNYLFRDFDSTTVYAMWPIYYFPLLALPPSVSSISFSNACAVASA